MLDNPLWRDRDLAQRILVWGGSDGKLSDGLDDHFLGRGVLTDHDVPALLVSLENSEHLIWQVWGRKRHTVSAVSNTSQETHPTPPGQSCDMLTANASSPTNTNRKHIHKMPCAHQRKRYS